jgi:hypothetical protein
MTTDVEKTEIAQQFPAGLRNRDWDVLKSIMTDDIARVPRNRCPS